MTYFFKKSKNKDEIEDVNNKHSMLIDDYENNEDEEDEMKCHTMIKDVVCSSVTSNDNKQKIKVIKSNAHESEHKEACVVAECEGELKHESKVVEGVKILQQDVEKGCVKCKINQEKSRFTEVVHETAVSELKEELFKAMFKSKEDEHESREEACLGIDEMHKNLEDACDIEELKRK